MKTKCFNFSCRFLNPNIFSNSNYNCSNFLDLRNLQEQVKKEFCHQKLVWPFTVWINCSSDLKIFENSRSSALNFKSFSRSLELFFLTVDQNNFGNIIPFWDLFYYLPHDVFFIRIVTLCSYNTLNILSNNAGMPGALKIWSAQVSDLVQNATALTFLCYKVDWIVLVFRSILSRKDFKR